jgi:TPR repeat protein
MTTQQSECVSAAETKAISGDLVAMEFLARRFFEGRGVDQSFQSSYYWSTLALDKGATCLTSLNQFALKKLSEEERTSIESDLKVSL